MQQIKNLWHTAKAELKEKFMVLKDDLRKERRSQVLYAKILRKYQQIKSNNVYKNIMNQFKQDLFLGCKGNMKDLCIDEIILYLDCANVNILVMILNYSVARCYHWVGIGRVHGIFLYSFSQFYVNLQHSQNKKCNKTSVGAQCNSTQSLVFK